MDDDLVKRIRIMTEEQLDKEIFSMDSGADMIRVYGRALDMCYSRDYCQALGFDYCNIRRIDFRRACVAAYFELKENKKGKK
jgi:hypothetical protein